LLTTLFNQHAHPRRLGVAFPDTRFVTPTWAPVPNVAYYRRGRIRRRGWRLPADFFEPPNLAVEVVSPEQSVTDLIKKCLQYIALGATVVLLVDSDPETVLVFRPGEPLTPLQGDDRIGLDDVLPGFELTVRAMFDALAPDWLDDEDETVADVAAQDSGSE
jgi:Uma2 family endonuclease